MKRKHSFLLGLLLLVSAPVLVGCSDDENITDPVVTTISGITDQGDIVVIDSGSVSLHEHYAKMLKEAEEGNSDDDAMLAEYARKGLQKADSLTDATIEAYLDSTGGNAAQHGWDGEEARNYLLGYRYYNIRYNSINAQGKIISLSELIVFPYNKVFANPRPEHICIGCHATIMSNAERPSNYSKLSLASDVTFFALKACSDGSQHLVIVPDYQGYGATHGDSHPFLQADLTARQVVDGVIAGRKWFIENEKNLMPNYKTFSIGYSQGGAVALAVQKYIERNGLSSELNFAGSISGGGPYSPWATLKQYCDSGKVYVPTVAAFMLKALCDHSPYLNGKYKVEDYLTSAFLKTGIIDTIIGKKYTSDEMQKQLLAKSFDGSVPGFYMYGMASSGDFKKYTPSNADLKWSMSDHATAYCPIEVMIKPEVLEWVKNYSETGSTANAPAKCIALKKALDANNLCKGWTPTHHLIVDHSTRDEIVPFVNYEELADENGSIWKSNNFQGEMYKSYKTYTHVGSATAFYAHYQDVYTSDLLNNKFESKSISWLHGGFWY